MTDEAGFRALFADQFDDVWRFARRRTNDAADADDVAAETFAVAWRRRADLPEGGEVRLWLFGTARHVLANQRRGDRRRVGLGERLASVPPAAGPPDPAEHVAEHEASPLWRALASLGEEDRELLLLRAWDELPVTDIATLLACTPNAASLRLHKARRRLAAALVEPAATAALPPAETDPPPSRTSPGRAPTPGGGPR